MTTENFSMNYRSIADRQLTKILLLSLGGSTLLHTVAIAGASYWASNHADDRIDVVEIERVELDRKPISATKPTTPVAPVIPTPPQQVIKPPTIIPTPSLISAKVSVSPAVIKITKSAAVPAPTLPLANMISAAVKPVAPPVKEVTITPPSRSNPNPSFPDRLFSSPAPKSAPFQPDIKRQIQSPKVLSALTPNNNSAPIKDPQPQVANKPIALTPTKKPTKSTLDPASGLRSIEPNASSTNSGQKPGNNPQVLNNIQAAPPTNNDRTGLDSDRTIQSGLNPNSSGDSGRTQPNLPAGIGGGTPGNNGQTVRGNSDRNQPISPIGSGLNGNGTLTENIATGSKNQSKIQCLRNCEIRYPEELESSDIGKDKILVRVTIDPNGSISNAEIARSSGNQKLDQFTLNGVKQMQLNGTGKTRTHRIKISTLINN